MNIHQKYEDHKSSASAFFVVGGLITLYALLCWTGIFSMPGTDASKYFSQTVITVMGIGSLIIAVMTQRTAKAISGELEEKEKQTDTITQWFLSSYTKEALDNQLDLEYQNYSEEERSLKRFDLIQDILITNHDLPEQSYVDELCEMLYEKLFE
jgi:hypothetical protein